MDKAIALESNIPLTAPPTPETREAGIPIQRPATLEMKKVRQTKAGFWSARKALTGPMIVLLRTELNANRGRCVEMLSYFPVYKNPMSGPRNTRMISPIESGARREKGAYRDGLALRTRPSLGVSYVRGIRKYEK